MYSGELTAGNPVLIKEKGPTYTLIMEKSGYKIASFYQFVELGDGERLCVLRDRIRSEMQGRGIVGTMIIASEGFNSTVCGDIENLDGFLESVTEIFGTEIEAKFSFTQTAPFRKLDVKVKPEIVTLKRPVEIALGNGTHVSPAEWNNLLNDPDVIVLDTRNDYEYQTGTFERAMNPKTEKFSELPSFIERNLDPQKHKKIAMFCTGGIRCEKFAPYMKGIGFENVYQLKGGILKYLEEVPPEDQRWSGECYVFDTRVTVDEKLKPGRSGDLSQEQ
jgi:UPF0176 protein